MIKFIEKPVQSLQKSIYFSTSWSWRFIKSQYIDGYIYLYYIYINYILKKKTPYYIDGVYHISIYINISLCIDICVCVCVLNKNPHSHALNGVSTTHRLWPQSTRSVAAPIRWCRCAANCPSTPGPCLESGKSSPEIPSGNLTWLLKMVHLQWIFPLKMVIFHSYVSLPEGTLKSPELPTNRWKFLMYGGKKNMVTYS